MQQPTSKQAFENHRHREVSMRVRVVCNFQTFKHENVQRIEIQPKRVRLETAEGQIADLPFDYAYGLAAVVVFEDRRTDGPHA